MGGRGGSSGGMGGFGGSAKSYWDNLSATGPSKYAAVEMAAKGSKNVLDNAVGRIAGERDLTPSQESSLRTAVQEQAKKWLEDNPRPKNPRKEGYHWDGKKYVR